MSNFTSNNVKELSVKEGFQQRPGMYIGDINNGFEQIIYEILSNSIDEFKMNRVSKIEMFLSKEKVRIKDNGGGIPYGLNKQGLESFKVCLTSLHGGSKFDNESHQSSGGQNGAGLKLATYLSKNMKATTHYKGTAYSYQFSDGDLIKEGKIKTKESGFEIEFEFWDKYIPFNYNENNIIEICRRSAFLAPGLNIILKTKDNEYDFKSSNGVKDYLDYITKEDIVLKNGLFYSSNIENDMKLDFAMTYGNKSNSLYFVNTIFTREGGTHQTAFQSALTRAVNNYARNSKILKDKDNNFTGNEIQNGLNVILNLTMNNPTMSNQTKDKLSSQVPGLQASITMVIEQWLGANKKQTDDLIKSFLNNRKAQLAYDKVKMSTLINSTKVSKKDELRKKLEMGDAFVEAGGDLKKAELYVCEGKSAYGHIAAFRDPIRNSAIGLRGKVIGIQGNSIEKILNEKGVVRKIVQCIGGGYGKTFDISKANYEKIIIACDADPDGFGIELQLLNLFFFGMRPLVEAGRVYFLRTPLFIAKKGKQIKYIWTTEDLKNEDTSGWDINRQKGLGEIREEYVYDLLINPETRRLTQITTDDYQKLEDTLNLFFDKDVQARRDFLMKQEGLFDVEEGIII